MADNHIDFASFVNDAWKEPNIKHNYDQHHPPVPKNLKIKRITGFYELCASKDFSKSAIEKYLIDQEYGVKGQLLREDDWEHIEKIQKETKLKYPSPDKY